ncbi:MAG TPA: hypothetical protein VLA12_20310, partial [Planctomycetaceae bacterium]|nr:hypothetical protein [Planctomycetaceae bacterium]
SSQNRDVEVVKIDQVFEGVKASPNGRIQAASLSCVFTYALATNVRRLRKPRRTNLFASA